MLLLLLMLMGMVKLLVKEIRRKKMIVRADVVDEDELMMAYPKCK